MKAAASIIGGQQVALCAFTMGPTMPGPVALDEASYALGAAPGVFCGAASGVWKAVYAARWAYPTAPTHRTRGPASSS
jgi:hypothetical protein